MTVTSLRPAVTNAGIIAFQDKNNFHTGSDATVSLKHKGEKTNRRLGERYKPQKKKIEYSVTNNFK